MDNTSFNPATSFPAILVGGPPDAGKSVLTYALTRELRRRDIPHFVFHANVDGEGDWFMRGQSDAVRQIRARAKGQWSESFRAFACRTIAQRQLPLLVDLGGIPRDEDTAIFQACTHSILLLKDEDAHATELWHRFTSNNGLQPIAELYSQLKGRSTLTARVPALLKGTITNLLRENCNRDRRGDPVFHALFEQVAQFFKSYDSEEIDASHCKSAPVEFVVNLKTELYKLAPDAKEGQWSADLLQPLLASLPAQTEMAVYGRAPDWVYGALAMHAYPASFHQFDACVNWIQPRDLNVGDPEQQSDKLITLHEQTLDDTHIVRVYLSHYYVDYEEANKLVFPEPPTDKGIIVSGKLPFWLFTSLARFYVQRNVPWIALDYASDEPIVIYSHIASHPVGQALPRLT